MAITEVTGVMKYKDADGNTFIMLPATTKENVEGLEDFDAHLLDKENPHGVSYDQLVEKPFWAENNTSVLLEETTLTITDGIATLNNIIPLVEGDEYDITVDGVKYHYTAARETIDTSEIIYVGDMATGDPFVLGTYTDNSSSIYSTSTGATSCVIKIEYGGEIVHKLDYKYIHTPNWNASEGEDGYIENRTHWVEVGEATNVLEWDGDVSTIEAGPMEGLYKISNSVPTSVDDLIGGKFVVEVVGTVTADNTEFSNETIETELTSDTVMDLSGQGIPCIEIIGETDIGIIMIFTNDFTADGISATKGVYITKLVTDENNYAYVSRLEAVKSVFGAGEEVVHKLDNKYLDLEWLPLDQMTPADIIKSGTYTTTYDSTFGNYYQFPTSDFNFDSIANGDIITVTFNGVEYTCTANVDISGVTIIFIGNGSISNSSIEDTGEPFLLYGILGESVNNGAGSVLLITKEVGSYSVSAYRMSRHISKLPDKYIPDTIARAEDVDVKISDVISTIPDSLKNPNAITIQANGTSLGTYDGSAAKTFNLTYANVGAAKYSHTHKIADVTNLQTELDRLDKFTVGKRVAGTVYTIDDVEVTAATGAEIFNNYTSNIATGEHSHAEGEVTTASGDCSHSEGSRTTASGYNSHAEGCFSTASGHTSHAEGYQTTASGQDSHAEGRGTTASGYYSHAEGGGTTASGRYSHAEGLYTTASGDYSHSEGRSTIAASEYQHTQGKYNIEDSANVYAHIVGNGTAEYGCSNAHTLDWSGNAWFAGDVIVGGTSQSDGFKLATESYVDGVKNDLLNGAGEAYDTLKELGDLIDDNKDAVQALNDVAAGKADKTHTHAISDVTDLQTTLDGKAEAEHEHLMADISDKPFTEQVISLGDTLTWDGDTSGLEASSELLCSTFYKVSEIVPALSDLSSGVVVTLNDGSSAEAIVTDMTSDLGVESYMIIHEGGLLFGMGISQDLTIDGLSPVAKGLYLSESVTSLTINGYEFTETVNKLDLEALPDHEHSWNDISDENQLPNKYLAPIETIGGDTLTWDGDTSGLENIEGMWYKITDVTPSLDDFTTGYTLFQAGIAITEADYPVSEIASGVLGNSLNHFVIVLSDDNAMGATTGTYLNMTNAGAYISSLTINGYTGFTTEKLKEEYLPEHTHSFESLEDKPFGDFETGGDTLTWDGDTSGLEGIEGLSVNTFYRISDIVPSLNEAEQGGTFTIASDIYTVDEIGDISSTYNGAYVMLNSDVGVVVYVLTEDAVINNATYPKGVYFIKMTDADYVSSLTINGYTGFPYIKPLDEKYIPDHNHDYENISNKPFGEESVSTDILPETTGTIESGANLVVDGEIPLVIGESYVVNWNGTRYEGTVTAHEVSTTMSIPRLLIDGVVDIYVYTEEANLGSVATYLVPKDGSTDITVSIVKEETVVHKMEAKFLPEYTENTVTAESTDGVAYTATIDGITELKVGMRFTMIPAMTSTSTSPTLNVNSLGAKPLRQRLGTNISIAVTGDTVSWLVIDKPVTVMYDGTRWVTDLARPDANNLYGTVPVESGGTGATTAAQALTNLGLTTEEWTFTLEDGSTVTKAVYVG